MKAFVRDTYGSPDVLELTDIDCPTLKDDEVPDALRYLETGHAQGKVVITGSPHSRGGGPIN